MKHFKTDVLVAGSGIAGCAAAISAAEKGANVVLIEKRSSVGGISVTGMGLFAVESRLQKLKNHMLTKEDSFRPAYIARGDENHRLIWFLHLES